MKCTPELLQKNRKEWYYKFDDFHKELQHTLDINVQNAIDEIKKEQYNPIKIANFKERHNCTDADIKDLIEKIKKIDNKYKFSLLTELFGKHISTNIHEAMFKNYIQKKIPCICEKGNKYVITEEGLMLKKNAKGNTSKTIDYILTLNNGSIYYLTLKHGTWYCGGGQDNQKKDIEHTLTLANKIGLPNVIAICDGDYYNHPRDSRYKYYIQELRNKFPNCVYTTCDFINMLLKMEK